MQRPRAGSSRGPCAGFNPHPVPQLDATAQLDARRLARQVVSILTQSPNWMQHLNYQGDFYVSAGFQSSPSPPTGCNAGPGCRCTGWGCFNPHPVPQLDATGRLVAVDEVVVVSILTQSPNWMQRLEKQLSMLRMMMFQSSPSPPTGCNGTKWCQYPPFPVLSPPLRYRPTALTGRFPAPGLPVRPSHDPPGPSPGRPACADLPCRPPSLGVRAASQH